VKPQNINDNEGLENIIVTATVCWIWILNLLYFSDSIAKNFTRLSEAFKNFLHLFYW
jgi:hypothetical protein